RRQRLVVGGHESPPRRRRLSEVAWRDQSRAARLAADGAGRGGVGRLLRSDRKSSGESGCRGAGANDRRRGAKQYLREGDADGNEILCRASTEGNGLEQRDAGHAAAGE